MMKKLTLASLLFIIAITAHAQKLPSVQTTSLRPPANLKIDGKLTEWDNQLQAHNNAVNISYTIANDDENLYLIVQAKDPRVIQKILMVGLDLTVNSAGKKDDKAKENVSITYPVLSLKYVQGILVNAGDKAAWSGRPQLRGGPSREVLTRTDSSVMAANKAFNTYSSMIKITGAKGIDDTLISVYNEQRIKTAVKFDNNGLYNYELAIPLKYIGLDHNIQKFAYNIKLNDWGNPMMSTYTVRDPATGTRETMDADPDLNSKTQFWGEYTLAKNNN